MRNSVFLFPLLLALNTTGASAYSHYHDVREDFVNTFNVFTYIYTGQLYSQCNFSDFLSYINNEMWRDDPGGVAWTEMGDMDGNINNQCWNGGFLAAVYADGTYSENALQPAHPWIGWHSYEMAVQSNPYWVSYYYNGYSVGDALMPNRYTSQINVGLESFSSWNNYFEPFKQKTAADGGMQIWTGPPAWTYWPNPKPLGPGVPEYDDFWLTVYSTYGLQKVGGPITNFY